MNSEKSLEMNSLIGVLRLVGFRLLGTIFTPRRDTVRHTTLKPVSLCFPDQHEVKFTKSKAPRTKV